MTAKPKSEASISRAGIEGAKRNHTAFTMMPSLMVARHRDNHDRAPLYSLAVELPELAGHLAFGPADEDESDLFCFARADVLARAASFKLNGQEQRIRVARSATGRAVVTAGYLRHAAALYLEVTGELAACPGMADGLRFDGVAQATSPEQQVEAVWHSSAENERKEATAIDLAWKCKRLVALQVGRAAIGERLGLSKGHVDRLLSLLALPVATQLAVHEGRVTMQKALARASVAGEGTAKGPRAGVRHTSIRRALEHVASRPVPPKSLAPAEILTLARILAGETVDDELSDAVREWSDWLDAPKDLGKPAPASSQAATADTKQAPAARRARKPKPIVAKDGES